MSHGLLNLTARVSREIICLFLIDCRSIEPLVDVKFELSVRVHPVERSMDLPHQLCFRAANKVILFFSVLTLLRMLSSPKCRVRDV